VRHYDVTNIDELNFNTFKQFLYGNQFEAEAYLTVCKGQIFYNYQRLDIADGGLKLSIKGFIALYDYVYPAFNGRYRLEFSVSKL
jgi:hypothetical protein